MHTACFRLLLAVGLLACWRPAELTAYILCMLYIDIACSACTCASGRASTQHGRSGAPGQWDPARCSNLTLTALLVSA